MRKLLPGTLAIATLALLLGGCSQPPVAPEHQAAWDVFEDARDQLKGMLTDDDHPKYVGLTELGIKPPAGIVLYARGTDLNHGESDEEPAPQFGIVVVNLADGVLFVELYPLGTRARRFDTIEAYDAQEYSVGLPRIHSAFGAYALQLEQAQRAYYEAYGTFADAEDLLAFSVDAPGPVPDVTPLAGYAFAASSDRYGYLMTIESPLEDYTWVLVGYGPGNDAAGYLPADLEEMIADDDHEGFNYIGVNSDAGHPLDFVEVDPADLDEDGRVPAVDLPAPGTGVSGG
jgi:hypothetical protein